SATPLHQRFRPLGDCGVIVRQQRFEAELAVVELLPTVPEQQRERLVGCAVVGSELELQRVGPGVGGSRSTSAEKAGQGPVQVAGADARAQARQGGGELLMADSRGRHVIGDGEWMADSRASLMNWHNRRCEGAGPWRAAGCHRRTVRKPPLRRKSIAWASGLLVARG